MHKNNNSKTVIVYAARDSQELYELWQLIKSLVRFSNLDSLKTVGSLQDSFIGVRFKGQKPFGYSGLSWYKENSTLYWAVEFIPYSKWIKKENIKINPIVRRLIIL